MIFDKNQNEFQSDYHKEIWWWGIGLVPPDVSLTDEVKNKCSNDILKGCYQWYEYFNELCEDMYNNTEKYKLASARQYRDIIENISANGYLENDMIIWNINDWKKYCEKFNKNKSIDYCLNNLKRVGIDYIIDEDMVKFHNNKYPKIFHAMNTFEISPNIRKTPARHHFAHCEFRQLFKSYSPNYDELLRRVSDESLEIAKAIHDYAKSLKIQRYVHFDTIKYKYKNIRVLDFTITGNEYPTLRINVRTNESLDSILKINPFKKDIEKILSLIDDRKSFIDDFIF